MDYSDIYIIKGTKQALIALSKILGKKIQIFLFQKREEELDKIYSYPQEIDQHTYEDINSRELEKLFSDKDYYEITLQIDGIMIREIGHYLLDDDNNKIGVIILRQDVTGATYVYEWIEDVFGFNNNSKILPIDGVDEMMEYTMNQAIKKIGIPVAYMKKKDKKEFIRYLDERGVFQIKKSSEKVASFLNISKFTLYTCLEEIRNENT